MSTPLFLGIDLGTSGVAVGLFTQHGDMVGLAHQPYDLQLIPGGDGWQGVEQDPDAWWQSTCQAIRDAVGHYSATLIAGICVGGQGPSLVAVDGALRPVAPAMIWMDTRATPQIERLSLTSGNGGEATALVARALWLAEHRPEAYARARHFLQAWDSIAARLCGVPFTSAPWFAANIRASGLDSGRFPGLRVTAAVVGGVTPDAAAACGLIAGIPVVSGTNDSIVGLIGCGVTQPGRSAALGGTSGGFAACWLETPGTWRPPAGTYPEPPGCQYFGAATSASGRLIDWYRAVFCADTSLPAHWLEQAHDIPAGSDGLLLLPYLAGERAPVSDPLARGVLFGLTFNHTHRHVLRAVLEGVAYSVRHVLEHALQQGAQVHNVRVFGGQARSPLWNQIKADVLGLPIQVPAITEAGALGAAIIAAAGVGHYGSLWDAAEEMVSVVSEVVPDSARVRRYDDLFAIYRELYPRLHDLFPRLIAR